MIEKLARPYLLPSCLWSPTTSLHITLLSTPQTHDALIILLLLLTRMLIGEGNGNPLQYSYLENSVDRGAWWAAVYGVTQSQTWLKWPHALEREMATHPSVLAWRIPGRGEPGGLPSMGSHRLRHDWSDLAAAGCLFAISIKCI